jgi:hypothetical protein
MSYLRWFNRFILISLALLGLSVSLMNTAQASSYKLTFHTDLLRPTNSNYFSSPAGAFDVEPGTHLIDIFFDTFPGGSTIDLPGIFQTYLAAFIPEEGKITGIDLYNYGKRPIQYNPYSAAPPLDYVADIVDDPRNGSVDFGFLDTLQPVMAPSPLSEPDPRTGLPHPWEPLNRYFIFARFELFPGGSIMQFDGQEHFGDWEISEISAVPVPAAVWLFGTALIGLVGFGKRRKTA